MPHQIRVPWFSKWVLAVSRYSICEINCPSVVLIHLLFTLQALWLFKIFIKIHNNLLFWPDILRCWTSLFPSLVLIYFNLKCFSNDNTIFKSVYNQVNLTSRSIIVTFITCSFTSLHDMLQNYWPLRFTHTFLNNFYKTNHFYFYKSPFSWLILSSWTYASM